MHFPKEINLEIDGMSGTTQIVITLDIHLKLKL